jgi:hypothetical protein
MLTGPVLVELIDRQERLANLHVLDVAVAAATRQNDLPRRKRAPIPGARAFGEIAIVLRGVSTMARLASDSGARVHVVLPELANPVFGLEVARQALSSWKILNRGISRKILSPGIGWNVLSPGIGAQRHARQNESRYEDLPHAVYPR